MFVKLRGALCFENGIISSKDVYIKDARAFFSPEFFAGAESGEPCTVIDNCVFSPGFLDVHVHLREPGFSYKETIAQGSAAAARGGYTDVCSMPNLLPVPDSINTLTQQTDIIKRDALIGVHPYAAITKSENGRELSDMEELVPFVCGFSDDGRGVQSDEVMKRAMEKAASLSKIIAAHCEDNSLLCGGYINTCEYQRRNGHRGICNESEWRQIERDLRLVAQTGCDYHVCHVSTAKSVELIRKAKEQGLPVTCETAPHYLLLSDRALCEDARFKMNPPLRSEEDRIALIEGIRDKTIDMIATDHAPHTDEEKSRGLEKSPMGVTGLECAFAVLYTGLVKRNIITLERLLEMMITAPRKRFKIKEAENTFSVIQLDRSHRIDSKNFLSKGHSTPFDNMTVDSECILTVYNGRTVWQSDTIKR